MQTCFNIMYLTRQQCEWDWCNNDACSGHLFQLQDFQLNEPFKSLLERNFLNTKATRKNNIRIDGILFDGAQRPRNKKKNVKKNMKRTKGNVLRKFRVFCVSQRCQIMFWDFPCSIKFFKPSNKNAKSLLILKAHRASRLLHPTSLPCRLDAIDYLMKWENCWQFSWILFTGCSKFQEI